jgi:hypothetical protein
MNNLSSIAIINVSLTKIPNNAFRSLNGPQVNLSTIEISHNKINSIGNDAFRYLSYLQKLKLDHNQISYITEKAFNFRDVSQDDMLLTVILDDNNLTSKSFEIGAFDNFNKPTNLQFYNNDLGTNDIKYLDENVFKTFLSINNDNNKNPTEFVNHVELSSLDCNDCRSHWLLENQKFEKQLSNITCSNGNNLLDSRNFKSC